MASQLSTRQTGGPVVIEQRACRHPVRTVVMCVECGQSVTPRQMAVRSRNRDT
jgi:hypothetical protein